MIPRNTYIPKILHRWSKNTDRILGLLGLVTGLIFGAWGIYLSLEARNDMARVESLQRIAQKTTLEATLQKVAFFDNPAGSKQEFETYPDYKIREILAITYEDVNSQMVNEYLASNTECYKYWTEFRSFLVLAIQSPEIFRLMGPGHNIRENYYTKLDQVLNNCWSL